jgi:ADP-ribose pyrophosphatase
MTKDKKALELWTTLESKEIFADSPWIRVSVEKVQLPSRRILDNFYQVQMRDYALIIAKTPDDRVVLTRQYKHGTRRVSLMFPGGAIEHGEGALEAARRELLEETGYTVDTMEFLGSFIQDANHYLCRGHYFLATGARLVEAPRIDDEEEADVVVMGREEILDAIQSDEVISIAAISALLMALNPELVRRRTSEKR